MEIYGDIWAMNGRYQMQSFLYPLKALVKYILTDLMDSIVKLSWLLDIITYLRGGISAPQNLQRTLFSLLLLGATWSLLHLGHVRLRRKIVLNTA